MRSGDSNHYSGYRSLQVADNTIASVLFLVKLKEVRAFR